MKKLIILLALVGCHRVVKKEIGGDTAFMPPGVYSRMTLSKGSPITTSGTLALGSGSNFAYITMDTVEWHPIDTSLQQGKWVVEVSGRGTGHCDTLMYVGVLDDTIRPEILHVAKNMTITMNPDSSITISSKP